MLQIKEGRVFDHCKFTLILHVYRLYTVITNRLLFYAIFTSSLCFYTTDERYQGVEESKVTCYSPCSSFFFFFNGNFINIVGEGVLLTYVCFRSLFYFIFPAH